MDPGVEVGAEASGEGGRWLNYDQLAALRQIDKPSAVKLATRNKWERRKSNRGQMQVLVPEDWIEQTEARRDRYIDVSAAIAKYVSGFETALTDLRNAHAGETAALRGELTAMRMRCAACEQELTESRAAAAELRAAERESARGLAARIMNAVRGYTLLRFPQAPPPARLPAASSDPPKGVGAERAQEP